MTIPSNGVAHDQGGPAVPSGSTRPDGGASPCGDRAVVNGAGRAVSAVPASIPSAWQFTFEAPAGARILGRDFFGIDVGWGDKALPDEEVMWFCDDGRWRTDKERHDESYCGGYSSTAPCRSFKAFQRHLRRHPEINGRKARLVSSWVGNDIFASAIETEGQDAQRLGAEHESAARQGDAHHPADINHKGEGR